MKSFDDFLASLTEDDYMRIAEDANNAAAEAKAETAKENKFGLGEQIGSFNFSLTLGLLRLYHEWLQK